MNFAEQRGRIPVAFQRRKDGLQNSSFLNTHLLVFNAKLIILNAHLLVFNAKFIILNTHLLVFNTKFIIFARQSRRSARY